MIFHYGNYYYYYYFTKTSKLFRELSNEKTLTVNNFFLRAIKEDIFKVFLISLTLCRKRLKYRIVSFLRIATKFQQAVRSIDHIRPYIIRP